MLTLLLAALPASGLPPGYPTVPMNAVGGKVIGMPLIGLGTWLYNSSVAEDAVKLAFGVGFRHVDTALGYQNQDGVGKGLASAAAAAGLSRSEYFVTSKIPGGLNQSAARAALDQALDQLFPGDADAYVDLMLVHFPATWTGEGGAAMRQEQWRAMEAWAKLGKARAIGVSHYCAHHLDDVLAIATEPVSLNQVQYHGAAASFDRTRGTLIRSELAPKPFALPTCHPISTLTCSGNGVAECLVHARHGLHEGQRRGLHELFFAMRAVPASG